MTSAGRIHPPPLPQSKAVLLVVDFVNPLDFPGAEALAAPAVRAAQCTARVRRRMSADGHLTIFANDNYGIWQDDFKELWRRLAVVKGPAGALARCLKPRARDFSVLKPRHSAFYSTPLDLLLRQLRCKKLVIAGLATDSCILATAMDGYLRGYRLWIPEDCVASESAEASEQALALMRRMLKADTRAAAIK